MSDEEEKAIAEQVGKSLAEWAEAKSDLERESALYHALRRERNYQILQAASRLAAASYSEWRVHRAVEEAIEMLEEIEKRNP